MLFCYEEAIGFCLGDLVNDKDGVSAGAAFGEMAAYLREHGRSICGHLDALYQRLGQFTQNNGYVICRQPKTTAAIFNRLRNGGQYWLLLPGGGEGAARASSRPDDGGGHQRGRRAAKLPLSSSNHMITFTFDNGAVATLRARAPSKIKWYAEMPGEDRAATEAQLATLVSAVIEEMLQPEANGSSGASERAAERQAWWRQCRPFNP